MDNKNSYKVLFGIKSDNEQNFEKNFCAEFLAKTGKTIEYKNEYYLKGIVSHLQENPDTDVLILYELLERNEPVSVKFMDDLSDNFPEKELTIIYIFSKEHTLDSSYVQCLFQAHVYNLISESDLDFNILINLIMNPRNKKMAKAYLEIDDTEKLVNINIDKELQEIDEDKLYIIINGLQDAGKSEENASGLANEFFDKICKGYTDKELMYIVSMLNNLQPELVQLIQQNKNYIEYTNKLNDLMEKLNAVEPDDDYGLTPKSKLGKNVVENVRNVNIVKEKVVKKVEIKQVEVIDSALVAVISNAPTGKSTLSYILSNYTAKNDYKTSVINIDRGYSGNVFYNVPEKYNKEIRDILVEENYSEILDKCFKPKKNLHIITGEICGTSDLTPDEFLKILNPVRAKSDITFIDCKSEVNELTKLAILHSTINIFVFDMDVMHYNLNIKMLEEISRDFNPERTIVVINNANTESSNYKQTVKSINNLGINFKEVIPIRSCGSIIYDLVGTEGTKTPYEHEQGNAQFKEDIDNLLAKLKLKTVEAKKSLFGKFFGK